MPVHAPIPRATRLALLLALVVLGAAESAHAARLSVVTYVSYWDARTSRSDAPGSGVLEQTRNSNRPMEDILVELVDQDGECQDVAPECDEDDDDVLDTGVTAWRTGGIVFRGASDIGIGNREDIYLRTPMRAGWGRILDRNGEARWLYSPAREDFGTGHPSGVYVMNWSISCYESERCVDRKEALSTRPGRRGPISYLRATEAANVLATAVEADRRFDAEVLVGTRGIDFYVFPDQPDDECQRAYDDANNTAIDRDTACIRTPFSNHRVGHEIGHVIHRRALRHPDDRSLSSCLNGHSFTQQRQHERCATSEAWADFIGTAIHFDRDAERPFYVRTSRVMEGLTSQLVGTPSQCISPRVGPEEIEGNVARFFWDLYDTTTEGDLPLWYEASGDDVRLSMRVLVQAWQRFPKGTGEGQAQEASDDGRNVWDYREKLPVAEEPLYLNCLCAQEQSRNLPPKSCLGRYWEGAFE